MKAKRITALLLAICLLAGGAVLTGCRREQPMWQVADVESIDPTLYEPTGVYYPFNQGDFVDAPGMIIYRVQGVERANGEVLGSRMAFINKATGTSHLFCFDPLCNHSGEDCIAARFPYVEGLVAYNQVANMLYAIMPDAMFGGFTGNTIYKMDLQANGATVVYEGDRNECTYLSSSGKYVFWLHQQARGGKELCRMDVETGAVDVYPAPDGKSIATYMLSGQYLYFRFANEIEYYLTDPAFSKTEKLTHFTNATNFEYVLGNKIYQRVDELDETRYPQFVCANYFCSEVRVLDALTGEEETLLSGDDAFMLAGVGKNGIYYYTFSDIANLYFLGDNGEKRLVYTFRYDGMELPEGYWPFNFRRVWEFHGVLYGAVDVRVGDVPYTLTGNWGVALSYYAVLKEDGAGSYIAKTIETYA